MKNNTWTTMPIYQLITVAAIFALAACGGKESDSATTGTTSSEGTAETTQPIQAASAQTSPSSVADAGTSCEFEVEVGDNLQYSVSQIAAPAACSEFTITLSHTGQLPANAMGHNWVLVPKGAGPDIAKAGISKGLDGNYLADDDRIIAATEVIGGGESTRITFALEGLAGDYTYICTYPGHGAAMIGTFTVES
ncbi:MAG: azurin [Chromatocurvus sp.]